MNRQRKKLGLLTFVGATLLVVALLSFGSSTWATPTQLNSPGDDTIPDKSSPRALVGRGQSTEFTILVTNPDDEPDTWANTIVTDTIDSYLNVTGLDTTQGSATWAGQNVTFTIGTLPPGSSVTLTIYVKVKDTAPKGYDVENTAYITRAGWVLKPSDPEIPHMFYVATYESYLALGMKRYIAP